MYNTKDLEQISKDIRAFIYQSTSDLQRDLLPGSSLSVVFSEDTNDQKYKVKFVLEAPGYKVNSTGEAENPYDAIKKAKEQMHGFLGDIRSQLNLLLGDESGPRILH